MTANRGTSHWTEFGLRRMPPMSTRTRVVDMPPPLQPLVEERTALLEYPISGLTADGAVRSGLYPLASSGVSAAPITDAAQSFLGALSAEQRDRARFPLDSLEWRTWINVHMNFYRHGVVLEHLPEATRRLGLDLDLQFRLGGPHHVALRRRHHHGAAAHRHQRRAGLHLLRLEPVVLRLPRVLRPRPLGGQLQRRRLEHRLAVREQLT